MTRIGADLIRGFLSAFSPVLVPSRPSWFREIRLEQFKTRKPRNNSRKKRANVRFTQRTRGLLASVLHRAFIAVHDAMAQDANVGVLEACDQFATPHAARKHRVDRARHLIDRGVVWAGSDVHASLSIHAADFRQSRHFTMNDLLLRLVAHMRWADSQFADALETDPPGEAVRLFAHVTSVEHLWYSRIVGRTPEHPVWPQLVVSQSRTLAAQHADLFEQLLTDADHDALSRVVAYRNSAGRDYRSPVGEIVTHVAMHGTHHRGQIARILRQAGREPPYTDYIQFSRRDQ
jgi:uncharacterized damage-inducible protein DinB